VTFGSDGTDFGTATAAIAMDETALCDEQHPMRPTIQDFIKKGMKGG